jgi:hypothetical protein
MERRSVCGATTKLAYICFRDDVVQSTFELLPARQMILGEHRILWL